MKLILKDTIAAVVFDDGSMVSMFRGESEWDMGGWRTTFTYALAGKDGVTVDTDTVRSGVGLAMDARSALSTWASFCGADADTYRSTMKGTPVQEWAYMHDGELQELACELDQS